MEQKTYQAKNFLSRHDLETTIAAEIGLDSKKNKDEGHTIVGKREELRKLFLDDTRAVFGVRAIISDSPTAELIQAKITKKK